MHTIWRLFSVLLNSNSCKNFTQEREEEQRRRLAKKGLLYENVDVCVRRNYSLERRGIGSLRDKKKKMQGYLDDRSAVKPLQCQDRHFENSVMTCIIRRKRQREKMQERKGVSHLWFQLSAIWSLGMCSGQALTAAVAWRKGLSPSTHQENQNYSSLSKSHQRRAQSKKKMEYFFGLQDSFSNVLI